MYPINGIPMNPMIPLFEGVKRTAANIAAPGEKGTYTLEQFQVDFPEFYTKNGDAYTPMLPTATLGDTSISYDNTATNAGTEKWGTWNLTRYGSQLATMARMIGIAGMYAI